MAILPDWLQAIAGIATFGAAALAVKATYDAPKKAAQFAEELRKQSQASEEERRLQLTLLGALLKHRMQISHPDSVEALNLVELAFIDDTEVRGAFRHFVEAALIKPFSDERLGERHRALIEKMARSLGLAPKLSIEDINRFYWPEALGLRLALEHREMQERLARFVPGTNAQVDKPRDAPKSDGDELV